MLSAHYTNSTFWHRICCNRCQHELNDAFKAVIGLAAIVIGAIAIFAH